MRTTDEAAGEDVRGPRARKVNAMSDFAEPVPPQGRRGREEARPPWLELLPAAWRRPGGLPPPDEVWAFLQEWVKSARVTLDELEGYLLAAVDEAALAALTPAARLADLERVRAGLDDLQKAADLDSFGLALRAKPGMLAAYERLVPWRAFFQSPDRPRLVMAHRYLTDDDLALPPEEAYRELRELRATLLDMLSDADTVLSAAGRRRFWDGFAAFQFRYADLYVREHDRRRRPEALAPYRALREQPAYRLLRRLQSLEGAPVRAGLAELEGRLQRLLATQCPGVDEEVIAARPVCTCGFRLDDPPPESLDDLERAIQQEAWHGLRMLFDPEVRRRLQRFVAESGQPKGPGTPAAKLAALLAWTEEPGRSKDLGDAGDGADAGGATEAGDGGSFVAGTPQSLDVIAGLLDEETIAYINQGLRRSGRVVVRSLEALVEELADRELSWDQLRDAVEQWAFGPLPRERGLIVRPLWGEGRRALAPGEETARTGSALAAGGSTGGRPSGSKGRGRAAASRDEAAQKPVRLPQTFVEWEQAYGEKMTGKAPAAGLDEGFRRFYRETMKTSAGGGVEGTLALSLFEPPIPDGLLAGLQRPVTLPLLLERASGRSRRDDRPRRLVWVDALRYDVWLAFLQQFGDGIRVEETGFLWALPPATTAGQMARVDAQGIRFSLWEVPPPPAAPAWPEPPGSGAAGGPVAEATLSIAYLRGIEEAIHGPEHLDAAALAAVLAQELLPLLERGGSYEWVVFSDHGFSDDGERGAAGGGSRRDKAGSPYRQGGDTMEEVIVPWARLVWEGRSR